MEDLDPQQSTIQLELKVKQPNGPPIPADVIVQGKDDTVLVMIPGQEKWKYAPLTHCYSHEQTVFGSLTVMWIVTHALTPGYLLRLRKDKGKRWGIFRWENMSHT